MTALDIITKAERAACVCETDVYWCRVCKRATCHFGEHSTSQLLKAASEQGWAEIDPKALKVATTLDAWKESTWMVR